MERVQTLRYNKTPFSPHSRTALERALVPFGESSSAFQRIKLGAFGLAFRNLDVIEDPRVSL